MKPKIKFGIGLAALVLAGVLVIGTGGCMTSEVTTVTPPTTNSVTGVVTGPVTNTATVVNEANLELDCAGLQLVGTPALIFTLEKEPAARPVVVDIQTALTGAIVGVDTNVLDSIDGLIGGDAALQASLLPLIQGASSLEQSLLQKYGNAVATQISIAILKAELNIVTAALAAVPPSTAATLPQSDTVVTNSTQ
jgi:hypothetical protein